MALSMVFGGSEVLSQPITVGKAHEMFSGQDSREAGRKSPKTQVSLIKGCT